MTVQAITHRRVLRIALPIVLSNATVPLLGAVDTAVVGQLGLAAPIGAVGIGAVVLSSIYWVFGFLRMGTTGLTAQAQGAGDRAEVAALLARALLIGIGGGLLLVLVQGALFALAFRVSPASDEVEALARQYMAIRIWSAPAAIAVYGINGWLIGQERTRSVLVLQLCTNLLNILLAIGFVLGLGWGVPGVATATALAEASGLLLGLWLCRDAFRGTAWKDAARVLDPNRLGNMARVNADILIRTVLLLSIFVSFQFWGAGMGDVTLAANQVLMQFVNIAAFALDGFAFATEALVGQAFGAGRIGELRQGIRVATIWGLGMGLLLGLAYLAAGPAIVALMTTSPEVRDEAARFLPWIVAVPLVGLPSWMLDGIFVGATRSRDMRNMTVVAVALYFATAWPLTAAFGNHGLWAALTLSWMLRAVTLAWRYPALERAALA
ncbi:DNA-damage-inducible protein F [Rubellimicrobium mesophilum DSM 19309]|uniref:DNA-damage-inducible protein F n=1 Tax=Rubellimicrobium mesophilum DSM 19309 TaxID=442562 RepID=A0A017HM99_9RHOB|nr:MATE family efflux transporter [Rubellimicrobium mesophilum]EYD75476.1 DNA-damage-inducible protein F [Rubellimicrobium mesophilum DSM 19309]